MNGRKLFEAFGNISDDLILDGDVTSLTPAAPAKRERTPSAFARFMNTPAAAAVISAVVAFAVLFFIVRAGQGRPIEPHSGPAAGPGTGTTVADTVTQEVVEIETETPEEETQFAPMDPSNAALREQVVSDRTLGIEITGAVLLLALTAVVVLLSLRGVNKQSLPKPRRCLPAAILMTAAAALFAALIVIAPWSALQDVCGIVADTSWWLQTENSLRGVIEGVTLTPTNFFGSVNILIELSCAWLLASFYTVGAALSVTSCVLAWSNRLTDRRGTLLAGFAGLCALSAAAFPVPLYNFGVTGYNLLRIKSEPQANIMFLLLIVSMVCALTACLMHLSGVTKPVRSGGPLLIGKERRRPYVVCLVLTGVGALGMAACRVAEMAVITEATARMTNDILQALQSTMVTRFADVAVSVVTFVLPMLYMGILYRKNKTPALVPVLFAALAVRCGYVVGEATAAASIEALRFEYQGVTPSLIENLSQLVTGLLTMAGCVVCAVEAARGWKHPRRLWWFWGPQMAACVSFAVLPFVFRDVYGASAVRLLPVSVLNLILLLLLALGTTLFVRRFPQPALTPEPAPCLPPEQSAPADPSDGQGKETTEGDVSLT